jgi:hypothetical protein
MHKPHRSVPVVVFTSYSLRGEHRRAKALTRSELALALFQLQH